MSCCDNAVCRVGNVSNDDNTQNGECCCMGKALFLPNNYIIRADQHSFLYLSLIQSLNYTGVSLVASLYFLCSWITVGNTLNHIRCLTYITYDDMTDKTTSKRKHLLNKQLKV